VIGGTSKNPGLVTIDASDASGNSLAGNSLTAPLTELDQTGLLNGDATSIAGAATGALSDARDISSPPRSGSASVPEPPAVLLPLLALACLMSRVAFQRLGIHRRAFEVVTRI
jgi:hypothetical protein